MKEQTGNIWQLRGQGAVVVITTNGFVKSNGACVMGRGIAAQALQRYPSIDFKLGRYIREFGNRPFNLGNRLASFPVKPCAINCRNPLTEVVPHMRSKFRPDDLIPGWACIADINIIVKSAQILIEMADKFSWENVFMPRPGCGAGNLSWQTVRPAIKPLLDDRFIVCTYN
jgi:hypothetical protein